MSIGSHIFIMLMYTLAGGLHFGLAVSCFNKKRYTLAGVFGMFLISMILSMTAHVFRVGGII